MSQGLVVIDVQNEYFDGALPIAYPDRVGSLANIVAAMRAARVLEDGLARIATTTEWIGQG
jgi:nicotinamidase-related amidase